MRDVEVDVLHQALVLIQGPLVVAVEPQLRRLEAVLLDGPGHGDVALHVHAGDHHVDPGLLHALDVGGHRGPRVGDLVVGVGDVHAGLLHAGRAGLARGRRRGDPVGQEADLVGLDGTGHIGIPRRPGGQVLHRAPGGEEVGRRGPVGGHVVAVGRGLRFHEDVGREEGGGHAGHGEHVVLVDQGVGQLGELAGVPAVVEGVLQVDLASVDPTLGVDVLEVGLLAVDQRREVRRDRSGLGRDGAHRDGVRRDPRLRCGRGGAGAPGHAADRDQRGGESRSGHCDLGRHPCAVPVSHAVPTVTRCIASPPGCRSL